jgi:hypothetical protein
VATLFYVRTAVNRMIALTSAAPGPRGPAAELGDMVGRAQTGGLVAGVLILVIVFLMVFQPGS